MIVNEKILSKLNFVYEKSRKDQAGDEQEEEKLTCEVIDQMLPTASSLRAGRI